MVREKMKPCAFCGGDSCGVLTIRSAYSDTYQGYCAYCGAKTAPKNTFDEAVERWNMRGDDFKPKVDRKLLCAREALRLGNEGAFRDGNENWTPEQEIVRAIELWEEGYGQ
jgi:hypothetical protein